MRTSLLTDLYDWRIRGIIEWAKRGPKDACISRSLLEPGETRDITYGQLLHGTDQGLTRPGLNPGHVCLRAGRRKKAVAGWYKPVVVLAGGSRAIVPWLLAHPSLVVGTFTANSLL